MLITISMPPSSSHFSNQATNAPTASPTATPPPIRNTKRPTDSIGEGVFPVRNSSRPYCRATRAVPSFTRLSASRISTMRGGNPNRLAIEVAAIASVAATTAPSRTADRQSNPGSSLPAVSASPRIVEKTRPTASFAMLTKFFWNSRHERVHAAA
jgi:hypothetical protein